MSAFPIAVLPLQSWHVACVCGSDRPVRAFPNRPVRNRVLDHDKGHRSGFVVVPSHHTVRTPAGDAAPAACFGRETWLDLCSSDKGYTPAKVLQLNAALRELVSSSRCSIVKYDIRGPGSRLHPHSCLRCNFHSLRPYNRWPGRSDAAACMQYVLSANFSFGTEVRARTWLLSPTS